MYSPLQHTEKSSIHAVVLSFPPKFSGAIKEVRSSSCSCQKKRSFVSTLASRRCYISDEWAKKKDGGIFMLVKK